MLYEKDADKIGHFLFHRYSPEKYIKRDKPSVQTFHNSIEIIAVVGGEFEVMLSGEWRKFGAGSLLYLDRLTPHLTRSAQTVEGLETYALVISLSYLTRFRELEDMTFDTVLTNGEPCEEIEELIKWGYGRFELMNSEMKAGFATMLVGAIKKNFALRERPSKKQYMLLLDIVEYISAHYAEPITLEVLANRFGYEKTYISKIINSMLGMNLREYINSYRITMVNRFKSEDPTAPLFKIGERCGFESANTFYRAYKRYG